MASELNEIISGLRYCATPEQAAPIWERARRVLLAAGVEPGRVEAIAGARDVAALSELAAAQRKAAALSPATLKHALKAFRNHLHALQLDDESRLGAGPMSKGRKSSIVAIAPPPGFPAEVWAELVRQGRLKDVGHGQYELVGE